ncbi:branched-chain amino acid ABC transporter permease [Roseomonas mucosa]|uniref:branched-chain amino acid ABC transporter permease n=1 Tax=Roseomonas mucosa TaxID=207340 RepID=UPI0028CC997F|nr:branched-chain amino acid ABC transporter permease [Roseomonas mucosa]MDT8351879.1 branched-chain amino acid ABC transporter permease [Roseomonas mucosa]
MSNARNILRHPVLWVALVLGGLTAFVLLTGQPLSRVTQIAVYMLYGAGVNLLMGYTGLVPFGASVFFGLASYAAALSMGSLFGVEVGALLFSIAFSFALAFALGLVILRRRGLYFSLLTLACSQIAFEIVFKWTDFTGGENGIQNVPRPWFTSLPAFHFFTLVTVIAAMWFLWRLVHAPFGRTLQAIRDNEPRVRSLGYDVFRTKLAAFVVSAGVIGYAGGLLAFLIQGAYANNLSWVHAGDSLLMTVLGGRAPFPRSALGRNRLHHPGGPFERGHRELVADLCAHHHGFCPALAGRYPRLGAAPAETRALDTHPAWHTASSGHYPRLRGTTAEDGGRKANSNGGASDAPLRIAGHRPRHQPGGVSAPAAQLHWPQRCR